MIALTLPCPCGCTNHVQLYAYKAAGKPRIYLHFTITPNNHVIDIHITNPKEQNIWMGMLLSSVKLEFERREKESLKHMELL